MRTLHARNYTINFNFKHTKDPVKLTMSSWQYFSTAKPTLKTILTPLENENGRYVSCFTPNHNVSKATHMYYQSLTS